MMWPGDGSGRGGGIGYGRRTLRWSAAALVLGGVSLALIVGSGQPSAAGGGDAIPGVAHMQPLDEGVLIFARQCAPCHGASGKGGIGPDLSVSTLSDEDRLAVIADGLDAMPAYGLTLTPAQLESVSEFTGLLAMDAGRAIFERQCAPCHGNAGQGAIGPDLTAGTLGTADLLAVISDGGEAMPAFRATLDQADLEAVASFVAELPAGASATTVPGPQSGAEIYSLHCSACHGVDASGGIGPALTSTSLSPDEFVSITTSGRGSMPAFGTSLSADEIGAVVAYLAGLGADTQQPDAGRIAAGADAYARRCAECHGEEGEGGTGPSLRQPSGTQEEIVSIIDHGRGNMPAFGGLLSAEEIDDVVAFLSAFGGTVVTTTVPDDLVTGEAVFADRCVECHGNDGSGGIGPSLLKSRLSINEIVSRVYGGHMSDMPAFRQALAAGEVQAVSRFTESLQTGESGGSSLARLALFGAIGLAVVGIAAVAWAWSRRTRTGRGRAF